MTSSSSPLPIDAEPETEQDAKTTQLKSALWLQIGRLVDTTTLSLDKNATPQFIGALTELAWHQIWASAVDVEQFARHAGRTVVDVQDVLLLARRNDMLKGLLEEHLEAERSKAVVDAGADAGAVGNSGKAGPGRPRKKVQKG